MVRPLVVKNPKLTMQFNGGTNGWSESHFYTGLVDLDNATLQADALTLVTKRVACLDGVNAKLFAAHLSLDDVNRDSNPVDIDFILPSPTQGYFSLGGPDPSDGTKWNYQTVHVSWKVGMETASPTCNPIIYLAGMPARVGQYSNRPEGAPPPTPRSYLSTFLVALINGKWGALGRGWSGITYTNTAITYTGAAGAVPPKLQFALAGGGPPANQLPVGFYVRLNGASYTSPQKRLRLNGTYTIADYNAATGVVTVYAPRVIVAPTFTAFGEIEAADGTVFAYNNYNYGIITHRKRGAPFGGGRGRA